MGMNIRLGLERISAVWWGFWGLLAAAMVVVPLFVDTGDKLAVIGSGVLGLVFTYLAHRLTCWVIAGFYTTKR